MPIVKAGATSQRFLIMVRDASSSTGALLGGLTSGTVSAAYWREGAASWTSMTLVGSGGGKTLGTWTDRGFLATAASGWYEFDAPNAAFLTGATWVDFRFFGATNMLETAMRIDIVAYDPQSATNLGLTNLDAAISSRSTLTPAAVWDALLTGITTAGSVGKVIKDCLDAAITSRMATFTYTAPDNTGIGNAAASAATAAAQATTAASQSATAATQSTTAATQATNAAASASSADGKLTASFTNMVTRFLTMIESYSGGTLWRFVTGSLSQAATGSGGGSAGTLLIHTPTRLAVEGQSCSTERLATISLQSGSSLAYEVQLVDATGVGVPTTGTTLSAKIVDGTGPLVEGITVEEILGSQGRITVLLDTRVEDLAGITYATLVVTRDNGDTDVTTYPAQLFIER